MALNPDQHNIVLAIVYNATLSNNPPIQLFPTIESIGGAVDVYMSNLKPVSAPTGMTKVLSAVTGLNNIQTLGNYLYVAQNSGTSTTLIVSGLDVLTPAT